MMFFFHSNFCVLFSPITGLPILPVPRESLVLGVGLRRPQAIEGLLNFRQLLPTSRVSWGQGGSGWAVSCCWGPVLNAPRRAQALTRCELQSEKHFHRRPALQAISLPAS